MAFVQYMILYIAKKIGLLLGDPIFFMMVLYSMLMYKRQIEAIKGKVPTKDLISAMGQDLIIGILIGVLAVSYTHLTLPTKA